jgi:hypothetical protein
MSEETVLPDVKTFDLKAVLEGRKYPEKIVKIYFDEELAITLAEADKMLNQLSANSDSEEFEAKREEFEKMLEDSEKYVYRVKLRGVPMKARKDMFRSLQAKYPDMDIMNVSAVDFDREDEYSSMIWQAYVVEIIAPDGSRASLNSADDVKEFRNLAPQSAVFAIDNGIAELENQVQIGFEVMAKSSDFLSKP